MLWVTAVQESGCRDLLEQLTSDKHGKHTLVQTLRQGVTMNVSVQKAAGPAEPLVTDVIRRRLGELPPAERRVARALLSGPPTAGLASTVTLAEWAGVSGPTVSRFVSRLGFASFPDFRRSLCQELDARVASPMMLHRLRPKPSDGAERVGENLDSVCAALKSTVSTVPMEEMQRAIELLSDDKRRVVASGGWFSFVLASHFVSLLQEVRSGCLLVDQTPRARAGALVDADRGTTVVLFDYRRYEKETHVFANAMHRRGARIVLFTDRWLSPVAEFAEIVIPSEVASESPLETLTPAMALVETIVMGVLHTSQDGANRFERFYEIADEVVAEWGESTNGVAVTSPNRNRVGS